MKKWLPFFLLVILPASAPAFEADDEWTACESNDECIIVYGNCGIEWAANKDSADISRRSIPEPALPCKKPIEFHSDNTVARCTDGKCALFPPGKYVGSKVDVEQ